jgi:hypothetical protein
MKKFISHPVIIYLTTLLVLSVGALAWGVQITKITEIAIYTLYGMGVNLLLGYTGLVPFGASGWPVRFCSAPCWASFSVPLFCAGAVCIFRC